MPRRRAGAKRLFGNEGHVLEFRPGGRAIFTTRDCAEFDGFFLKTMSREVPKGFFQFLWDTDRDKAIAPLKEMAARKNAPKCVDVLISTSKFSASSGEIRLSRGNAGEVIELGDVLLVVGDFRNPVEDDFQDRPGARVVRGGDHQAAVRVQHRRGLPQEVANVRLREMLDNLHDRHARRKFSPICARSEALWIGGNCGKTCRTAAGHKRSASPRYRRQAAG